MGIDSMVSTRSFWSWRLAPAAASPIGTPERSVRTDRFAPFCPVGGIWAGLPAAERRLAHGAVARQPLPVDAVLFVVAQQAPAPELLEDAGPRPLLKAPVGRARVADARGVERVPLHARAQHKQDRVHRRAVGHPRAMAASGCDGRGGSSGSISSHSASGIRQPSSGVTKPIYRPPARDCHRRAGRFDVRAIGPSEIGP